MAGGRRRWIGPGVLGALAMLVAAVTSGGNPVGAAGSGTGSGTGVDPASAAVYAYAYAYLGGYSGRRTPCTFEPYEGEGAFDTTKYIDGEFYRAFTRRCGDDPVGTTVWIGPPRAPVPRTAAYDVVRRTAGKPRPGTAPPSGANVVGVATWFWTDPGAWAPVVASAWVPGLPGAGDVWATVTATPTTLRFDPGDGSAPVECAGPGTVWTVADGDEATSDCSVAYRHSSLLAPDGHAYRATMSIAYAVTFVDSTGAAGTLPGFSTSAPLAITVGEIQAVALD